MITTKGYIIKGKKVIELAEEITQALLVVIRETGEDERLTAVRLEELESLVTTMEAEVVASMVVPLRSIEPATLIGTGKIEELQELIDASGANTVIFDHDLSPRAQRNLERILEVAVIDRQEVILQIFSNRAMTKEAVLQVALARQEYSLPRLTRMWSHLSRQRGGMRGTRDAGETQLEMDRRIVTNKISSLKKQLKKVEEQRGIQRKSRRESFIPTAAIVGYTNAGKSSLLNLLAQSDAFVENKLFATLDPTTRQIQLPQGGKLLLSDTVGFVSNLPHQLIEAFKSTLEEAVYSDFLIHVVDAAHPDMVAAYETTMEVLASLGCEDKKMVVFINKMDRVFSEEAVEELIALFPEAIKGSIKEESGIDSLLEAVEQTTTYYYPIKHYLFPHSRYDLISLLRGEGLILATDYLDEGVQIEASVPQHLIDRLAEFATQA